MKKKIAALFLVLTVATVALVLVLNKNENDGADDGVLPINDYVFCSYDIGISRDEEILIVVPVFFDMNDDELELYRSLELDFVSVNGSFAEKINAELVETNSGIYFQKENSYLDNSYALVEYTLKLKLSDHLNDELMELSSMTITISGEEHNIPVEINISQIDEFNLSLPLINYMDESEKNVQSLIAQVFATNDYNKFLDLELVRSEEFKLGAINYAYVDSTDSTQILNPSYENWDNEVLGLDPNHEIITFLKVYIETNNEEAFKPYTSGLFKFTLSYNDEETSANVNLFVKSSVIEALREYEG